MATDSRWKRPWEDSHSSSYGGNHLSRGASSTASVLDSAPPPTPGLPSSAISITNPSFDSVSRQLPSLPQTIPAHSDSTILPGPDIRSPRTSASNLHDRPAERWESSFDGFQRKRRRVHDCLNEPEVAGFLGDLARDVSAPALDPLVRIERRSRDATFNFLPRGDECCSRLCVGPKCARVRILVQEIATELSLLDCGINETVSALTGVSQPSRDPPRVEQVGAIRGLEWVLDVVRLNSARLGEPPGGVNSRQSDASGAAKDRISPVETLDTMKRRQDPYGKDNPSGSSWRPHTELPYDSQRPPPPPSSILGDHRRSVDMSALMHSPRSSSASAFLPQQSPLMASQQSGRMLPSPTSINFPHSQLPPLASPHASAHSVHLQDLQHQVSIKTLALQTLRSEYDSLLQKLERQRTKCATLEKKFEVTDVEINSLTDERERLQAQVISLEAQVEDLQKSRDEAKRQLVTNGAQYMKIVDMANQLQAKCADDRRKWAIEKEALDEKIRGLEDAMVAGVTGVGLQHHGGADVPELLTGGKEREPTTADDAQPSAPSSGAIRVLKVEIARLRAKNQMMDLALKTMKEECHTMQVTLQAVVNSGQKIQQAADTVIGSENR